jgi:hypothetical protein
MSRRHAPAPRVPETSTNRTYPRLLVRQDGLTKLQTRGALIRIETSSSADAYGLLPRNTTVGEENVRCEAPSTDRPRDPYTASCPASPCARIPKPPSLFDIRPLARR